MLPLTGQPVEDLRAPVAYKVLQSVLKDITWSLREHKMG